MGFYNVDMFVSEECAGKHVFYVRPFSEELKKDLDRLVKDVRKVSGNTEIIEKNGTYAISTGDDISGTSFYESFWGMLFRRFMSESKRVCLDPITEEHYYVVIFSDKFIAPCKRKLVA